MEKWEQFLPYKCVLEGGTGEIVEKRSRFLAEVRRVETEGEAVAFVEEMKKRYWDASHNCSAFVIGRRAELTRCSDDGEPSGTAGRPMLEVLLGEGICNVAVVVTRYFGGTLLGTGGLVRAYGAAVKAGLENSRVAVMRYGTRLRIGTDYSDIGRIQYILGKRGLLQENAEYTDRVSLETVVAAEEEERLKKELTEATGGRAVLEAVDRYYFIDKGNCKGIVNEYLKLVLR